MPVDAGFDGQDWYQQLFEYGLTANVAQAQSGADPDEELIPRLVTQLVLPLAAYSLKHAWKPHSRSSTAAVKAVLEDLLVYVPPEEPKLQVSASALISPVRISTAANDLKHAWTQATAAVKALLEYLLKCVKPEAPNSQVWSHTLLICCATARMTSAQIVANHSDSACKPQIVHVIANYIARSIVIHAHLQT